MSLYLCVFRDNHELAGVDAGSYEDFERFRDAARALDHRLFRRFPTLRHNISPTLSWSPADAARLLRELTHLDEELRRLPPRPFPPGSWQERVARERGLAPESLRDCFIDVDGEPLIDELMGLCRVAIEARERILFQ